MSSEAIQHILLLDDSEDHLEELSRTLEAWGFQVTACLNVAAATSAIQTGISFAIVDLFLAGNEGDELSNGFVVSELLPRGIPFIRMSSAPGLVPAQFSGLGVYDKRMFRRDRDAFRDYLNVRLSSK